MARSANAPTTVPTHHVTSSEPTTVIAITVPMMALIFGNATALGIEDVRDIGVGAGSGFMGFSQFLAASIAAPLVGLGSNPALAMSLSMITCAVIALTAVLTLTKSNT